jgi:hypothetical protein
MWAMAGDFLGEDEVGDEAPVREEMGERVECDGLELDGWRLEPLPAMGSRGGF